MSYFNTIDKKIIQQANESPEQIDYNNQGCYPQQGYHQQYHQQYQQQQYQQQYQQQQYQQQQYQQQQYQQQQYQQQQYQQEYQEYCKQYQEYQDQQNCQIPQINIPEQKINISKTYQESTNNSNSYLKQRIADKNYLDVPNSPCIIKIEGDGNILSNNNYQLKQDNIKIDDTNFKISDIKFKIINIENSNIEDSKIKISKIEDSKIEDSKIEDSKIEDSKVKISKIEDSKIEDSKIEDSKIEDSKIEDSKLKISKIEDNKIDDELLEAEYIVIHKIYNDNILKYIKAINKNGQKVLINIDENSNDFNLSKKSTDKLKNLPYNIKTSAINCINNVVCGVALQCGNNEMCIINKDSKNLKIKETLYDYNENNDDKNNDDLIVYPVIKWSEIKLNPKDLLINTDVATARLQNMTYNTQLENLGTTSVELNKLNSTFNKFNLLREEITDKLKTTLKQLKEINIKYNNDPQMIYDNKDLYKQVQKNLLIREENMMKLSNYIKKFADKKTQIENINNELDAIIDNCTKNFENIDLVL